MQIYYPLRFRLFLPLLAAVVVLGLAMFVERQATAPRPASPGLNGDELRPVLAGPIELAFHCSNATFPRTTSGCAEVGELEKAGLIIPRKDGSGHYDRFRDRLMFPIRDARGRAIGFGGRVLGKEGAEGLYVMAVRGPVALGVAFKIADGQERARDGVAMELLRQIGSLSAGEFEELSPFYRPVLRNHRGIEIGDIVCDFELEEA